MGCNHVVEIWSIYDGGVVLFMADGDSHDKEYDGFLCDFCPLCGEKLPEHKKEDGRYGNGI